MVSMLILPKLINRFHGIPIKIPISFYFAFDMLILKCIQDSKGFRTVKTIAKNNYGRGLKPPDSETYHKATAQFGLGTGQTVERWNRAASEVSLHTWPSTQNFQHNSVGAGLVFPANEITAIICQKKKRQTLRHTIHKTELEID